jgi:myo-inositol 2-dehydrogenase/D-chiro-inositol 1-dehydrogenase
MTFKAAIIGSGAMGHEHIRNLALIDGIDVVAVVDPDQAMRASAHQLAGGDCVAFASHRALLRADIADALIVATPNHTHIEILRDLLPADKPILIEKPLATTLADCREIIALARRRAAPVWVAMEYRFMPPIARLIEEVRAGTAGSVKMLAIREHRYPFLEKVGDWNRFNVNTGGTLVEKCCHFFDLRRLVLHSEPVRVYASGGIDVNHLDETYEGRAPDILDNAFVIVDFANGTRAMLDLCMFAEGSPWQEILTATGDIGRVTAFVPGPGRLSAYENPPDAQLAILKRADGIERRSDIRVEAAALAAGDHQGATYYQHQGFLKMLREGGAPAVSLRDGLISVALGAAAERSARTGQAVALDAFDA